MKRLGIYLSSQLWLFYYYLLVASLLSASRLVKYNLAKTWVLSIIAFFFVYFSNYVIQGTQFRLCSYSCGNMPFFTLLSKSIPTVFSCLGLIWDYTDGMVSLESSAFAISVTVLQSCWQFLFCTLLDIILSEQQFVKCINSSANNTSTQGFMGVMLTDLQDFAKTWDWFLDHTESGFADSCA